MWDQILETLLVILGGFVAVAGAMIHDGWKKKRDRKEGLEEARALIRKLVRHNEEMARRLLNEIKQGRREDTIYFMLSAWHAIQIEFAKRAATDEYVDAATHFEEARFLDEAWRRWKRGGTKDESTVPTAEALRKSAATYLAKYKVNAREGTGRAA